MAGHHHDSDAGDSTSPVAVSVPATKKNKLYRQEYNHKCESDPDFERLAISCKS